MKITPKFQQGGNFSSLFTTYQAVRVPQVQAPMKVSDDQSISVKSKAAKESDSDDTKGKLTEKDLYTMIKDINGLPNEMKKIVSNLKNTLAYSNLQGVDTGELSNIYLNSLYKLKVANDNKAKFDEAVKASKTNGSLGEVAISMSGKLLSTDKDGQISEVSVEQYYSNPEQYNLLTNSNLAWLRKYSPNMAFQQSDSAFEIINNGMGYESFQALLDKSKTALGNYKYEETGVVGKEALLGLKTLQGLSKEQQEKYIKGALEGKYKYTSSTDSNAQQIQALINYLTVSLPKRAKVWASIKTGIANENKATQALVGQYLSGQLKSDSTYTVDYLGTEEKLKKASNSSSGGSDTKEGFWAQLQSGKAGDESKSTILIGKTNMSVDGKYYGTTPGLEENKSLSKYIGDSRVGYLIQNTNNITFGDQSISPSAFKDIMVNSGGGAITATLPVTPDGKVDFKVLDTYSKVVSKLKASGVSIGTREFEQKKAEVLKQIGLGYLVDAANGTINTRYFRQFLILEGITSNKAFGEVDGKKQEINGASEFIKDVSSDDDLFGTVEKALSDKDNPYKLDHNWISFNNNKLYKGNIYIPLNTNTLNAMNADKNDVKAGESQEFEKKQQEWSKREEMQDTGSDKL